MPRFTAHADYEPGAAGGACYLCHAAPRDGETVVSTGVSISYEGLVWVCATCIREMGALVGLVDAGAAALAVQEAETAREAARRAEETAGKATALADHLSGYNEYRRQQDQVDAAIKAQQEQAQQEQADESAAAAAEAAPEPAAAAPPEPEPEPEKVEPEAEKPKRHRRS